MNISTLKEPRRLNTRTPFSSVKTASRFALALVCLLERRLPSRRKP
jgi:hypothetical protein